MGINKILLLITLNCISLYNLKFKADGCHIQYFS